MNLTSIKNRAKSFLLDYKNKIQVVHELDYSKKTLYVCDNIRLDACVKEPETVAWIETFASEDIVYDIGANVGCYTLIMSLYAKKVFAFEPAFMNYSILNKNIFYNTQQKTIPDNITALNIALAEDTGIQTLHYINTHLGKSGSQLTAKDTNEDLPFQPSYSQPMLSLTIDDFIHIFKLTIPQHMKIDVDGIEYKILKGGANTLASPLMKSLMIEVDTNEEANFKDLQKYLSSKDFSFKSRTPIRDERFFNYFFEKK